MNLTLSYYSPFIDLLIVHMPILLPNGLIWSAVFHSLYSSLLHRSEIYHAVDQKLQ